VVGCITDPQPSDVATGRYEWAGGHNAEGLGAICTRDCRHTTSSHFEMYPPESGLGTAGGGPTVRA
jgi:hypothetical protein